MAGKRKKSTIVEAKREAALEQGEQYRKFLRELDIKSIALVESSFRVDRRKYFKNEEHERAITWRMIGVDSGEGYFQPKIGLMITASEPHQSKPFFELAASYELHIHLEDQHAENAFVNQFCESEIKLIVWPYFREFVTNSTARMHIPPLTLPVLGRD